MAVGLGAAALGGPPTTTPPRGELDARAAQGPGRHPLITPPPPESPGPDPLVFEPPDATPEPTPEPTIAPRSPAPATAATVERKPAIPLTPPPQVQDSFIGVEQWRGLVESIFPAFSVETVLRIMRCESGGNSNATGSAGERGLMQIHPLHFDSTYDPTGNLLAAFRISGGGTSWGAWTCR